MLITTELLKTRSVEQLVNAWAQLYMPESSAFPDSHNPTFPDWIEATLPAGRAATVAKLDDRLLKMKCQVASIETNALYTYMPHVLDLNELRQLVEASMKLYGKLFDLYQQHASTAVNLHRNPATIVLRSEWPNSGWSIPNIEQFAAALEPVLLEFQSFHAQAKDWRSIGFLTTQLNFCNYWLLQVLTPPETLLLAPYFRFVEEHIAHPWQRVCAVAANYTLTDPMLNVVTGMIPVANSIAHSVHRDLVRALPRHLSRRGSLDRPGVAHSCIRDLKMFQAYLWLCVLEQNMVSIEEELVPLCLMVLPSVGVRWELVNLWIQLLAEEVLNRTDPTQRDRVLPYLTGMHDAFVSRYRAAPESRVKVFS